VAAGFTHADVVLGHPTALPVGDEVYGFPPVWPRAFSPDPEQLAQLHELCERVSANFTTEWNAALLALNPAATPSSSAFAEHGDLLLLNYPEELADPERTKLLSPHVFLGSAVREEALDAEVEAWLASSDEPFVYVSFGSFLSVRSDVLARVAEALRRLGVRAAIALGSADRAELGELPDSWLVRPVLPQVTVMRRASAAVTHGGNNSVTEAMTCALPLVVLPFSTDQFAGAAAIEAVGFGVALAPNTATVDELAQAIEFTLALPVDKRRALDDLGASLVHDAGRLRAFSALNTN
jgi:UDP:flavonoid glycosyltransferase YjiC (YdhE family)